MTTCSEIRDGFCASLSNGRPRCPAGTCFLDDSEPLEPPDLEAVICERCDRGEHGECAEHWASWCDCECNPCTHPPDLTATPPPADLKA